MSLKPEPGFLRLERVIRRLLAEDGFESSETAQLCIADYEQFFLLAAQHPSESLTPSVRVDLVWQRHMLDTRAYMEDCRKFAGRYIHRHDGSPQGAFERCANRLGWGIPNAEKFPARVHTLGCLPVEFDGTQTESPVRTLEKEELCYLITRVRCALLTKPSTAVWVREAFQLLDTRPTVALDEYRRFLTLMLCQRSPVTPSKLVDEFWHQHILDSRNYFAFCARVAERYLHHAPSYEKPHEFHRSGYSRTQEIYTQHFGLAPIPEVWAHMGESGATCSAPEPPPPPYELDSPTSVVVAFVRKWAGWQMDEIHRRQIHPVLLVKGVTMELWQEFLLAISAVPHVTWSALFRNADFRWRAQSLVVMGAVPALAVVLSGSWLAGLVTWLFFLLPCLLNNEVDPDAVANLASVYTPRFAAFGVRVALTKDVGLLLTQVRIEISATDDRPSLKLTPEAVAQVIKESKRLTFQRRWRFRVEIIELQNGDERHRVWFDDSATGESDFDFEFEGVPIVLDRALAHKLCGIVIGYRPDLAEGFYVVKDHPSDTAFTERRFGH